MFGGQKTHMGATASVLIAIVLRWMCRRCNCWWWWCCWWYWNWCTATLFHTNWCPCSHIIGESTTTMSYYWNPVYHGVDFFSLAATGFLWGACEWASKWAHKCTLTSTQSHLWQNTMSIDTQLNDLLLLFLMMMMMKVIIEFLLSLFWPAWIVSQSYNVFSLFLSFIEFLNMHSLVTIFE